MIFDLNNLAIEIFKKIINICQLYIKKKQLY
jgi:hypothetical protein